MSDAIKSNLKLTEVREVEILPIRSVADLEEFVAECRDAEKRAGGTTGTMNIKVKPPTPGEGGGDSYGLVYRIVKK
jgi:hypothetical protein